MAPSQRPIGRPRSHAMLLAGLLVCTLVLATLLAYEAHDAARSHRATAERALHDYAAVAAWELVAGVNDELQSSVAGALAPVTRARASSPYELLPAPAVLSASAENALRCLVGGRRRVALLLSHRLSRRIARDGRRDADAGDARMAHRHDHGARAKRLQTELELRRRPRRAVGRRACARSPTR